jgi:assimilatory nitrate reductase catalytic subunit
MLDAMGTEEGVRAMMVFGSNLAVSSPRSGHIQQKLQALDLLVVADLFLSETARLADVVLPVTQWAEEEGTMTNLEGRVLLRRCAKAPPAGVWTDAEILTALAQRLGRGKYFTSDNRVVWEEFRRATAGAPADYAGITYERIEAEDGVFWPCPSTDHPGTPRLFLERFNTPDGRARFHAVTHQPAGEEPDDEFPLYFTTGRVLGHYQSGTQTRRIKALRDDNPAAFIEMHRALADEMEIEEGEKVRIVSRRGEVEVMARVVDTIRRDTVFMPFHWGGRECANLLTNPALDPTSRMPEFKLCAVRVETVKHGISKTQSTFPQF